MAAIQNAANIELVILDGIDDSILIAQADGIIALQVAGQSLAGIGIDCDPVPENVLEFGFKLWG